MKRLQIFIKILLLIILFTTVSVAEEYTLKFKNTNLLDFVKFVAEFTHKNFVYDEKILKGQLTIDAKTTISTDNIFEILNEVLTLNNLALINRGNYYEIVRDRNLRDITPDFKKDPNIKTESFITSIFSPANINSKTLLKTFSSLKSKYGVVTEITGLNVLIVKDKTTRIKLMQDILKLLDNKIKDFVFKFYKLKNSSAKKMDAHIKSFFNSLSKQGITGITPVTIADDTSNTIIVMADNSSIEKIDKIVNEIDTASGEQYNKPKVFYLKNAISTEVEKILLKLLATSVDPKSKKRLSNKIAADKATNSIIVMGDPDLYSKVEELIKKLDIPRKQVYVEALIMETSLDNLGNFGVEWLAGGGNKNFAATTGYLNTGTLTNFQSPVLEGNPPNFSALPGGFTLGVLGNVITYEGVKFPTLSALVNALKSASGINILSNPQILTLDNEEAEVFVGENRPFVTSTKFDSNNNPIQTFDYRDVGIKLKIRPHISSDNTITLYIEQEVKKVIANASVDVPAPITLTRQTKTSVKLQNGAMMVISGLIRDDSSITKSAVPGLSKIPLIGWLFKSKNTNSQKTNMLVFLTAHIINTQEEAKKLTESKKSAAEKFNKAIKNKVKEF